jgi:cytochrome c553
MAIKEEHPKDSGNHVSAMVSSKTCAKCHEKEVQQFLDSGHARGAVQMFAKKGMVELMYHYEGMDHPDLNSTSATTGCVQCHGSVIETKADGRPTKETWPNYGIATAYPDGGTGSCVSCHSRHKFDMKEARKPEACASCHLGPDHPNIEIYNNSMHGHIFNTEGDTWKWDSAPDTWDVMDYRAPTCATCHMSGIGDLNVTHNVSERLKWNLWGVHSNPRTKGKETAAMVWDKNRTVTAGNALAGHAKGPDAARAEMKMVCKNCHASTFTDNFFEMGDKHVMLYNVYNDEANKMLKELKAKGLLKKDEWEDEFQKAFYYSWHHEGRRMRMGALMGAPDYAHWHGVFEVKNDIRIMREIYKKRMATGKIED